MKIYIFIVLSAFVLTYVNSLCVIKKCDECVLDPTCVYCKNIVGFCSSGNTCPGESELITSCTDVNTIDFSNFAYFSCFSTTFSSQQYTMYSSIKSTDDSLATLLFTASNLGTSIGVPTFFGLSYANIVTDTSEIDATSIYFSFEEAFEYTINAGPGYSFGDTITGGNNKTFNNLVVGGCDKILDANNITLNIINMTQDNWVFTCIVPSRPTTYGSPPSAITPTDAKCDVTIGDFAYTATDGTKGLGLRASIIYGTVSSNTAGVVTCTSSNGICINGVSSSTKFEWLSTLQPSGNVYATSFVTSVDASVQLPGSAGSFSAVGGGGKVYFSFGYLPSNIRYVWDPKMSVKQDTDFTGTGSNLLANVVVVIAAALVSFMMAKF